MNQKAAAMKRTVAKAFVLMMMALMGLATPLKSQESVTLSAGVGFPEMFHLKLQIPVAEQLQLGAFYGNGLGMAYVQADDGTKEKAKAYALGFAAFYHFGGQSAHTPNKPWYLRAGLNYVHFDDPESISNYTIADLRLGRVFNLAPRFGLEFDAGLTNLLSHNYQTKPGAPPQGLPVVVENKLLPAFGLRFFYRI